MKEIENLKKILVGIVRLQQFCKKENMTVNDILNEPEILSSLYKLRSIPIISESLCPKTVLLFYLDITK